MFLPRSPDPLPVTDPRSLQRELQRRADRVCALIVATDYPVVDVWIEAAKVRDFAAEHFPERMDLFAMIYEARLLRLLQQCRPAGEA